MESLEPPDTHHLSAAQGWLELGNHLEANEELEKITPALRSHPDVLELRWSVYYFAKKWEACFDIGLAMVQVAPERSIAWIRRASSMHYTGRSREAYDLLFPALEKFPDDWWVHYDMACYASVIGKIEEARALLEKAFELGGKLKWVQVTVSHQKRPAAIKQMALDDPDLENLWANIGKV